MFAPGSPTECDFPLCCSADLEASDPSDPGAGHWGAYSCDTPPWTLESTLAHIKVRLVITHIMTETVTRTPNLTWT